MTFKVLLRSIWKLVRRLRLIHFHVKDVWLGSIVVSSAGHELPSVYLLYQYVQNKLAEKLFPLSKPAFKWHFFSLRSSIYISLDAIRHGCCGRHAKLHPLIPSVYVRARYPRYIGGAMERLKKKASKSSKKKGGSNVGGDVYTFPYV